MTNAQKSTETATLGGGCFWCTEAAYWARIPLAHGQRWQLAGAPESAGRDWLAWVRHTLPVAPAS